MGYLVGCSGDAWARRWARHQLMPEAVGGASGPKEGAAAPAKPPPKPARRSLAARARAVRGAALRALSVVEPREASDYASVGTSGGVAVAFNAPVAGVAYAAEVRMPVGGNWCYGASTARRVVGVAALASPHTAATITNGSRALACKGSWCSTADLKQSGRRPARALCSCRMQEGNTIYSVAMLWRAVLAAASAIFSMQLLTWAVRARRGLPETRLTLLNSLSYRDTAHVWSTFW